MRLTIIGFVSALLIAIAAPMSTYAGTITIYNKNCTKTYNFATKKRVKVHVFSTRGCTEETVTVRQGHYRTVEIAPMYKFNDVWKSCGDYAHEAVGTVAFKYDAPGDGHTDVTCKKDWLNVCQCTKD